METAQYVGISDPQIRQFMFWSQMEWRCLILSGALCFQCVPLTTGSDWFVQRNLRWERDICTYKRFTFAPFSLCCGKSGTTNLSEGGRDTETPGGHGTDPSDSLVNLTYVQSHMPTDISYTVNVKMWKICTFGNLKNMPVGVFFEAVL